MPEECNGGTSAGSKSYRQYLRGNIVDPNVTRTLRHDVDFGKTLQLLEGNPHPHAYTLRGRVRSLQNKFSAARQNYDRAKSLFAEMTPGGSREYRDMVAILQYWLHVYRCETALVYEARNPTRETRSVTDREFQIIMEFKQVNLIAINQARRVMSGMRYLLRADYENAWYAYETLIIESSRRIEDQQADFYIGASVAIRALGDEARADKYLDHATMVVDGLAEPLKVAMFSTRLHVLADSLGREERARSWLDRLDSVECPEESKECLLRRARSMHEAAVRHGGVMI